MDGDTDGDGAGSYCLNYEEIEGIILARFEETSLRAQVLREVEEMLA